MPRRYNEKKFTIAHLRATAEKCKNWGKWGPDDQIGTLNYVTPQDIVDRLQKEIAKIVAAPDVKEKLDALGFIPIANSPQQFGARIKAEMAKWGKVVHAANLKIE